MGNERGYGYFAHEADIGIVGRGETVEGAFVAAAEAMFAIGSAAGAADGERRVAVVFEEGDVELALVTWLNELLGASREAGLALGRFALRREGDRWEGEGWGRRWSEAGERGVEVKGATLTMLSVRQTDGGWEARCVVDV